MSKNAVTDWSTTAASNTDIGGISLAEGVMLPSAVNNALREMMAQIATGVAVKVPATATVSAYFQLAEATNNGVNTLTLTPTTSLTANRTATFPDLSGTVLYADAAQTVSAVHTFSAIPVLSGGAITFPATQVPSANANTLDDYEEGTFTPAFSATGCTFSYAEQAGTYTKIGNRVLFSIRLELNTSGNTLAANTLSITGLPFAAAASPTYQAYSIGWANSTSNFAFLTARLDGGATSFTIRGGGVAATTNLGAQIATTVLHATNGSVITINGEYSV